MTGDITSATQQDAYTFQATAGGTIEASAGGGFNQGLKLELDLYTPAGVLLTSAKSANPDTAVVTTAMAAATGTYTAIVRSEDGSGGYYHFGVAAAPGTATLDPLDNAGGPIASTGVSVQGNLNGQLDVYSFAAVTGAGIDVSAGGGFNQGLKLELDLYDTNGKLVASNASANADTAVVVTATAATGGTYYAVVRSEDGSGGYYNFSVAAPGAAAGTSVANGVGVTGNINGQLDEYSFAGVAGGVIEASAGGGFNQGLNLELDLYTPTGVLLATAKSASPDTAVVATATAATSGTYYAVVRSLDGSGGEYHFSVAAVPGTATLDPLDNAGGPIANNGVGTQGSLNGQLDLYSFAATAGGTIEASAGGGFNQGLKLELDLYTPAGALLTEAKSASPDTAVVATATAATTGTYYAVVRSEDGSGGYYNISVAAPGAAIGGVVASGAGVAGNINGQLQLYGFAAAAGGAIEASAGGAFNQGLKLELDLYTAAGVLLTTAKSANADTAVVATATATTTGTYYAVVRSEDGSGGDYHLSVAALPGTATLDPLDNTGGPIANGVGVVGNINGQLDEYSFTDAAGGTIEASAGGGFNQGLKLELDLYDPSGKRLTGVASGSADQAVVASTSAALAGTYYAVIRSADGSGGNFNFSVAAIPGAAAVDPQDKVGGPITSGAVVTGTINGQLDEYSFAATAGGAIEASVGGGFNQGLKLDLDLYDPNGNLVTSNASANADQAVVVTAMAAMTGTFYAVVRSADGSGGSYNFSVAAVPGSTAAGPIASGVGLQGNLNGQLDLYSFAATAGGTVEASAGGGFNQGLKLELDLYTPTGALLATAKSANADTAVGAAGTAATTGTYYAVVRSEDGSGGTYHFSIASVPGTAAVDPLDKAGGPLASGASVSGNVNGNLDEYSFSESGGQAVEVTVTPGGFAAEVDLFGPGGALLRSATATTTTQVAADAPVSGVYYAVVRSATGGGGNYTLAAHVVAPAVQTLNLNQPVAGEIFAAYAINEWTFAAAAGTQVQFDLNKASAAGIVYTLTGPNGYAAFSNATASSSLTNLPTAGTYTLTVQGVNGAAGGYAFTMAQTSVTPLTLGTTAAGAFAGSGQAQLYTVQVPTSDPLSLVLADPTSSDHVELYASFGTPPTRETYQYGATGAGSSQRLLIPDAAAGTWYVLAYADSVATPLSGFTLLATAGEVMLTAATPGQSAVTATTNLTITGAGFSGGSTVSLVSAAGKAYPATTTTLDLPTQLSATLAPGTVPAGTYSIKVTQADGSSAVLPNALSMAATGQPLLTTNLELPNPMTRHIAQTLYIDYSNVGGAPMPAPLLILSATNPLGQQGALFTLDPALQGEGLWTNNTPVGFSQTIEVLASGATPGVLQPGESERVPVYYAGWLTSQWDFTASTLNFSLQAVQADNALPMNWAGQTYVSGQLTESYTTGTLEKVAGSSTTAAYGILPWANGVAPTTAQVNAEVANGSMPLYVGSSTTPTTVAALNAAPLPAGYDSVSYSFAATAGGTTNGPGIAQSAPPSITAGAWNVITSNLESAVGGTLGNYVQSLDNQAAYLGQLGRSDTDVQSLFGFEVEQADNAVNPLAPYLTSVTDDAVATPGSLSLSFGRVYASSISGRDATGSLGLGWSSSWATSAVANADGSVTLNEPGDGQLTFEPDSRTAGAYFSPTGITSTLAADGSGGYLLTDADGTQTDYTAAGLLNYTRDTDGNRITAAYTSGLLTSLTASAGQYIKVGYNAAGLVSSLTDSDGRTTTYGYDPTHTYLTSVTSYAAQVTTYTYDTTGDAAHGALLAIAFPGGTHQSFTYDAQGRLASTYGDNGSAPEAFAYNLGQVSTTDGTGDTASVYYDQDDEVAKSVDALGNPTYYGYDANYNLTGVTDAAGQSETYAYNRTGEVTSSTDFLGNTTTFAYGGPFNEMSSMTDANGNKTGYGYDSAGDLLSTTYADGTKSSSTFNPLGQATSFLNQNGQTTGYAYNAAGQVTKESFASGTSYSYTYDANGNLLTAVDPTGTTTFTYAPTTEYLTEVQYPGGLYLKFTYNAAGQRTQMVDQTGFTTNYAYDADGRLSQLTDGSGNVVVTYTYDADGRLSRKVNGNGTYTTYTYDADGNVLTLFNDAPGGTVNSSFVYTYNALGLETTETTIDGQWAYGYDADGQLTHAVFTPNAADPDGLTAQNEVYNYDAMGNRTSTVINGVTTAYAVNDMNEYTSVGGVAYSYDKDGNLVSDGNNIYAYDALDQLTEASESGTEQGYTYNALGEMVASSSSSAITRYLIDPVGISEVEGEYDAKGDALAQYRFGLDLVSTATSGAASYYDFDLAENTAAVTDGVGSPVSRAAYDPFGQVISDTSTSKYLFGYSGQAGVRTLLPNLYSMRNRDYSAMLGRFLSTDPLGLADGSSNPYDYVTNDPVVGIDPRGLAGQCVNPQCPSHLNTPAAPPPGWLGYSQIPGRSTWGTNAFHGGLAGNDTIEEDCTPPSTYSNTTIPQGECTYDSNGNLITMTWYNPETWIAGTPNYCAAGTFCHGNPVGLYPGSQVLAVMGYGDPGGGEFFVPSFAGSLIVDADHILDKLGDYLDDLSYDAEIAVDEAINAVDPNALYGPSGTGSEDYVSDSDQTYPYLITFENSPTATAPAQEVTVADQLPSTLDWSTFQLTGITFGGTTIIIPAGSQHYETVVPMTYNGTTFDVQVEAGINIATGQVYASFFSVDPTTGLPPANALIGFLPPEDGTGRGQGSLSFTVSPVAGLATGTQIRNVGSVTFDQGLTIATDLVDDENPTSGIDTTKQALVTIDAVPPTSSVSALPPTESSPAFPVAWAGTDDAGGSGVAGYTVYVSTNGGPFAPWLTGTTLTTATFTGVAGDTYAFYAVATDNVGNVQPTPNAAQATTTVAGTGTGTGTLSLTGPADYLKLDADGQHLDVWTNATGSGAAAQSVLLAGLSGLIVTGAAGGTTLAVDFSAGDPLPAGGLTFAGVAGAANTLAVIGTAGNDAVTVTGTAVTESAAFGSATITYGNLAAITFAGGAGSDTLTQLAQPGGGATLAFSGSTAADTLAVNAGTYTFAAAPAGSGVTADVLGSLSIAAGAKVVMASPADPSSRSVLVLGSLAVAGVAGAWVGTLDLGGDDMILHGGSLATTTSLVAGGFAGGRWTGPGLASSAAAADSTHLTALGVMQDVGADGTTPLDTSFDGQAVSASDVLVKYTYYGDLNLDGVVNAADYLRIDAGYVLKRAGWANGDLNGDGVVDGSDYTLMDNAFNQQAVAGSPEVDFSNGFSSAGSSITANGNAAIVGGQLQVTPDLTNQAGSAYYSTPLSVGQFHTRFDFTITAGPNTADGFTFVVQNAGANALGVGGGDLGYAGIGSSVAVKFDLYDDDGEGPDSTGLYTDGVEPLSAGSVDLTGTGVDLHAGHTVQADLDYDGTRLTVLLTDTATGATATQTYTVNIPAVVGASKALFGFTGGTGGSTAAQTITSWTVDGGQ